MPFMEYRCAQGHTTERFFKSISVAETYECIPCGACGISAQKIFSVPLGFGFYGNPEGYHKPSATKRFNTKTVSQKEGNASAIG